MTIDVSELMVDPDFTTTFTVRRCKSAISEEGDVALSYDERAVVGIVQPARPFDVQTLPEGLRLKEIISVWSIEELRSGDGRTTMPDVLIVDRASYRVVKAEPRPDGGYFRALAEGFVP